MWNCLSRKGVVLRLRTASHTYKSTYRLITILAVYENGLGLSQDNPLCLLFILPCSLNDSQRFQTHVLYRSIKWLMGALLKRSRLVYGTGDIKWLMGALLKCSRPVSSTWRRSPLYVQYRRRSLYCVLYIEHHIGHSSI